MTFIISENSFIDAKFVIMITTCSKLLVKSLKQRIRKNKPGKYSPIRCAWDFWIQRSWSIFGLRAEFLCMKFGFTHNMHPYL